MIFSYVCVSSISLKKIMCTPKNYAADIAIPIIYNLLIGVALLFSMFPTLGQLGSKKRFTTHRPEGSVRFTHTNL